MRLDKSVDGQAIKSLDWEAIIGRHPLFESLDAADRAALLDDDVSQERTFAKDSTILRQGDIGTSIFLIGAGAATVVLQRRNDDNVPLYTIGPGELFGEMAVIEDRPRSATILAAEEVTALEIKGDAFMKLLRSRGELSLVLLASMSQRLRYTDLKITEKQISGLDDSIALLSSRVDSIMQATDANLRASQAMFDQTKLRANEIIDSAGRARSQMTWVGSIILAVVAIMGVAGLMDIKQMRASVENDLAAADDLFDEVNDERATLQESLTTMNAELEGVRAKLPEIDRAVGLAGDLDEIAAKFEGALARIEQAESTIATRLLLDHIEKGRFSDDAEAIFADALRRFDRQVITELSGGLSKQIGAGRSLFAPLESVRNRVGTANPNGFVFLTYFMALSKIADADVAGFYELQEDLDDFIARNRDDLKWPSYVSSDGYLMNLVKLYADADVQDAALDTSSTVDVNARRARMISALLETMDNIG